MTFGLYLLGGEQPKIVKHLGYFFTRLWHFKSVIQTINSYILHRGFR